MQKEKILLYTLAIIQFTNIVDFMIMMPLGQQLMRVLHIDAQHFGFLVAAYTLSAFFSGLLGSIWLDRFDRKTSMLILYTGFVAGTFACALAQSYELLLAARIFTGAFGGLMGASVNSMVGDAVPAERRGQAMGIVMTAFSIASIAGVPFAVYLAAVFDWHAPFFMVGGFGVLMLFVIRFAIPSMRGHLLKEGEVREGPLKGFAVTFSNPNQRSALLFIFVMMLGHFMVVPFISPYMVSNVGFTEKQLAFIYLVGGSFTFFTSPLIGKLADKHGKHKVFFIFLLLSIIPILLITHMPATSLVLALSVTAMFFVCSNGRMVPANALMTSAVDAKHRGRFLSLNSAVIHLATSCGSLIGGLIVFRDTTGHFQNYDKVGYITVASCLISLYLITRIKVVEKKAVDPIE
ncbi:MAG TPA: MFS transporter [Bacteroidia bacterium]|jgi:predicted MFS family arabinose efflux permease|nr:MFS transporter [Bacteroidia bacterium]